MALTFDRVRYAYGQSPAVVDVSLTAARGQVTCLLGESGCGKTTMLRLAAGILGVEAGEIRLDDQTLSSPNRTVPPEDRPVGLIFQDGALFPHMTVADNVGYGLRRAPDRAEKVADLLETVGLAGMAARTPRTLSGGQQQRVAVARALAPEPEVLLLDEPFANLDPQLRGRLREEVRDLLVGRDCASILVTHEPEEALILADHIAVMAKGEILQQGTGAALYDDPAHLQVARILGGGSEFDAVVGDEGVETAFGCLPLDGLKQRDVRGPARLLCRADGMALSSAPMAADAGADAAATGIITDIRRIGPNWRIVVTSDDATTRLVTMAPTSPGMAPGDRVALAPLPGQLHAFPAQ